MPVIGMLATASRGVKCAVVDVRGLDGDENQEDDHAYDVAGERQIGKGVKQIIAELNPALRGGKNKFPTGNAHREFHKLVNFVILRMRRRQYRRGGRRVAGQKAWTSHYLNRMGLPGTVCYPTLATSPRSSLSCVRENRTHSLRGAYLETGWR